MNSRLFMVAAVLLQGPNQKQVVMSVEDCESKELLTGQMYIKLSQLGHVIENISVAELDGFIRDPDYVAPVVNPEPPRPV